MFLFVVETSGAIPIPTYWFSEQNLALRFEGLQEKYAHKLNLLFTPNCYKMSHDLSAAAIRIHGEMANWPFHVPFLIPRLN